MITAVIRQPPSNASDTTASMIIRPTTAIVALPSSSALPLMLKAEPNALETALNASPMLSTALTVLWICAKEFHAALLSFEQTGVQVGGNPAFDGDGKDRPNRGEDDCQIPEIQRTLEIDLGEIAGCVVMGEENQRQDR